MNLFHESKKILDKDGKVNPLGPYGRQKLTGREVSTYFRRNPVKDAQIKKAVEVALDLQGAMTVASKEIKKFYGDKILRSKEVQKALKYANESVEHDIREDLQEVSLGDNMLRKDFPNVWASKDAKLYRVLARLISQDGFVDNMKAYKKNPKDYLNRLRNIAKNPKKYEKSFGPNFSQYINNPKPNQHYAKLPESLDENKRMKVPGMGDKIGMLFKTKDKKEIDGIANLMNMTSVKVLQAMMKQNPKGFKRMAKKMGELPAMEEVQESVEKTTEKLVERNMLGRLAKQLKLNEEGKQKMFTYFEKGELNQ